LIIHKYLKNGLNWHFTMLKNIFEVFTYSYWLLQPAGIGVGLGGDILVTQRDCCWDQFAPLTFLGDREKALQYQSQN
jgi:hypothetical protein